MADQWTDDQSLLDHEHEKVMNHLGKEKRVLISSMIKVDHFLRLTVSKRTEVRVYLRRVVPGGDGANDAGCISWNDTSEYSGDERCSVCSFSMWTRG